MDVYHLVLSGCSDQLHAELVCSVSGVNEDNFELIVSHLHPSFLGFVLHPHRHLEPSPVSIQRLCERARRLHEHGADHQRLRRYVHHWHLWFTSGLGHLADPTTHETRYWQHVVNYCGLDLPVHPGQ